MSTDTEDPAQPDAGRRGLLHSTVDAFVDSTRTLVEGLAAAGGGTLSRLPAPVPEAVNGLLASIRSVADQMPPITAEVDVLVEEVRAKRLSLQALQAELGALDGQLAVLEQTLAPLQAWSGQWNRLRSALGEAVGEAR